MGPAGCDVPGQAGAAGAVGRPGTRGKNGSTWLPCALEVTSQEGAPAHPARHSLFIPLKYEVANPLD